MHTTIEPSILYFGTPVVLLSTQNEDGTPNVAPMSSIWFLGWSCMIGLGSRSQTTVNLLREKECVLNLPSVEQVHASDRLARLTGANPVPPHKQAMGYRHEKDKLAAAGLTATASELVRPPRVTECPIQMEAVLQAVHPFSGFAPARDPETAPEGPARVLALELKILRLHADESLLLPGKKNHIDADKWRPLIMSFAQYYGLAPGRVLPSRLAEIPEESYRPYASMSAQAVTKGNMKSAAMPDKETLSAHTISDPRWAKVVARDREADFVFSVKTTGVYCRPSCAARRPRPENVRFHQTGAEAAKAGFRACLRCKPDQASLQQQQAETIARVCRRIERSDTSLSLKKLAAYAGMSLFHFHRAFKTATGLTPKQYAAAHRANRVRTTLERSDSVTHAIYDAGFNSSGRFYETSNALLGMTPSTFRAGGVDTNIQFAIAECSLGSILVARSDRGVCSILLGEDPQKLLQDLQDQFPKATLLGNDSGFEELVSRVVGLIENPGLGVDLPLDIRGTVFQQRVWKALQQISAGTTATYSEIAKAIGMPKSARAVAQACAHNSLAVAIPCHRVVRSDGALSGYRWGVERKRVLLAREARAV